MPDYKISKECPNCHKVFRSYRCKNQKTCSRECSNKMHSFLMQTGQDKICTTCDKSFYVSQSRLDQKYCSLECYQNRDGKYSLCPICGTEMLSQRRTCSHKCMGERYKTLLQGESNPNWKGGHFSRENSGISAIQREILLIRDSWKCQHCGAVDWSEKPSLLHAHHVIPHEEGGTKELSNLITLCFVCHWEGEHGYSLNEDMQEIASKTYCGDRDYWDRRRDQRLK